MSYVLKPIRFVDEYFFNPKLNIKNENNDIITVKNPTISNIKGLLVRRLLTGK